MGLFPLNCSIPQSIVKEARGEIQGRNLESETEPGNMEKCCFLSCSVCFLIHQEITYHSHRWQRPQLVWPLYVKQASVKKNTSQASYRPIILKNFLSYGVIFLDNLRVYQIYETNKQTKRSKNPNQDTSVLVNFFAVVKRRINFLLG